MGDRASVVTVLPISFPPPKSGPLEGPGARVGGEEGERRRLKGHRRGRGAIRRTEKKRVRTLSVEPVLSQRGPLAL